MGIVVLGLNHRTAPVELREQVAFSREGVATALMLLQQQMPGTEAAILSTCNRVEVIARTDADDAALIKFLAQARNIPAALLKGHLYVIRDSAAIRHVFRVISGLDSMVLGEYQIVNQLKSAYQMAHEQNTTGPVLHRLFHHAFGVSKRVRTETCLGEGKTSVSSVAVDVIRRVMPDYADRRILMVGAGEMAQLAVQRLRAAEARDLVVTTRTLQNARVLAEACGGRAAPFAELDRAMAQADIIVTATSCPMPILTAERVSRLMAMRDGRQVLLVDLAVPRNVDASVTKLTGVTLFDVDALGALVEASRRSRAAAAEVGEQIVGEEVEAFERWMAQSAVGPLIQQMFADVRTLAQIEVRSMYRKCPELSESQRAAVEQLADRLVAKLMHPCVQAVRDAGNHESASMFAEAFRVTRETAGDRAA